MNKFYTYAFLREDGRPYYIGKGSGDRLYVKSGRVIPPPTDKSRIIKLKENLTEEAAYRHEEYLIAILPNLRNLSTGGKGGTTGCTWTEEQNKARSVALQGDKNPFYGRKHSEETIQTIRQKRTGQITSRTRTYLVIHPDGKEEILQGIGKFAKENGLDRSGLVATAKGRYKSWKGYKVSYVDLTNK